MEKKQEIKFNEYVLHIGTLTRIITLTPYDWGISVVVTERNIHETKCIFSSRKFSYTEKCKTTEQLVRRIEKYYKIHVGQYYQPSLYSYDKSKTDCVIPDEMASFWVWRTKKELIACMKKWGYERKHYVIHTYKKDDIEGYSIINEDGNGTFSIEIY